jgi:hypothetical protein
MELTDGRLYHGSTVIVRDIDLNRGVLGKDFGQGFYTTRMRDQAVKFAAIKAKRHAGEKGIVSVFQYTHDPELAIKIFETADDEWLFFVLKNRTFSNRQKNPTPSFDLVIGPVANDAVGIVINQLLIGTYGDPKSKEARNTAIHLLDTTRLYHQVFFGTNRAVSCLRFLEAFEIGIN